MEGSQTACAISWTSNEVWQILLRTGQAIVPGHTRSPAGMHSKSPRNEASRFAHNETKPPQLRNPPGGNSHECDTTSGLALFHTSAACALSALLHSFFALWFARSTNNFFSNLFAHHRSPDGLVT